MVRNKYAILLLLSLLLVGCLGSKREKPKYVFFITLDTTRADYIDYTLTGNTKTPNLAALAEQGIRYDNAYSLIPVTLPSHYSMFYSMPPNQLKIYNNGQTRKVSLPSMAQIINSEGYRTGAVVSLGVLRGDFGLAKGFEDYIESFEDRFWHKSAADVNAQAFEMIKNNNGEKAFYWLHYSDPHEPYFSPEYSSELRIYINGELTQTFPALLQPQVKIKTLLKPGLNRIGYETTLPEKFKTPGKFQVQTHNFRTFEIIPSVPIENLEIDLPDWWQKRENRNKEGYVNYFGVAKDGEIRITNLTDSPAEVEIRFQFKAKVQPNSGARQDLYGELVTYVDDHIGRLVRFLKAEKMFDDSVFVIMGDHGEGLGEYRTHYGHIHYLNKVFSWVPLIICGPGIEAGQTRQELVSTLNIAPTILDLLNVKPLEHMVGQSLLKPLDSKPLLLETYSPEAYFDAFSLIKYPYQLIFYPGRENERFEFMNLETDPFGSRNIFDESKKLRIRSELYNSLLEVSRILTAEKGKAGKISRRHLEMLRSLGYL